MQNPLLLNNPNGYKTLYTKWLLGYFHESETSNHSVYHESTKLLLHTFKGNDPGSSFYPDRLLSMEDVGPCYTVQSHLQHPGQRPLPLKIVQLLAGKFTVEALPRHIMHEIGPTFSLLPQLPIGW